jgi:hypothetical protein
MCIDIDILQPPYNLNGSDVNITTSSQAVYTQYYACIIKGEQFPMIFIIQQFTEITQ